MQDTDLQVEPGDNQEPERPEWLPDNFKTPDDLVTSYKESQRKITEESQTRKALEQQVEFYEQRLAESQQPQQPAYDANADPLIAGYEQAMEIGDHRAALAYQAQIMQAVAENTVQKSLPQVQKQYQSTAESQAALVADHAWNNLKSRYGDELEENREKMREVINANPYLIPDEASRDPRVASAAFENVYRIVNPDAFVQGRPVDQTAAKMAAQGLPGAAGRPPSPDAAKAEWETIANAAKNDPGRYW